MFINIFGTLKYENIIKKGMYGSQNTVFSFKYSTTFLLKKYKILTIDKIVLKNEIICILIAPFI